MGIMGGVSVPFFKPSQLKPSNHLKINKANHQRARRVRRSRLTGITFFFSSPKEMILTCASGCLWHRFSSFPASPKDYPCAKLSHTHTHTLVLEGNQPRATGPWGQSLTCIAFLWGWQRFWWFSLKTQSCRCPSGWCCRSSWDRGQRTEGCPGGKVDECIPENSDFFFFFAAVKLASRGFAHLPVRSSNMRIPRDQ